jgi:plasmid replication initiation protein
MKDGYTNIENKVLMSNKITPNEKLMICLLELHMHDKNTCYPSIEKLAELSGLNRKTVIKSLKGIIEKNYYLKEKLNGRKNIYKRNY